MRNHRKKVIITLSGAVVITVITFLIFSIPLINGFAPLGNIFFPGNGLWLTPGEVPDSELYYIEGLSDDVVVYRDEWGIPHIYGATEEDVSFALGYVHAQDRFFQMDLIRRFVRGRVSEVMGELSLTQDKYNLATGKEYWANKSLQALIELAKTEELGYLLNSFYSYVDGVNYYLNTHQHELPIEYAILGYKPTEWTLLDSMCYTKYIAEMLTWQYDDLYRLINYNALGEEKFTELFTSTYGQIPICPNYGAFDDSSKHIKNIKSSNPSSAVIESISKFLIDIEKIPVQKKLLDLRKNNLLGSNNWVVDSTKSSTGKPILCNDMHFGWLIPGLWYEAHLVVENTGLNVYGTTLAGLHLPFLGHNEYVAWGFTNVGYDVMDWYYYTEIDSNHYNYNGSSMEYQTRTYSIPVKGKSPVEFTVKETIHGPVLNYFLKDFITDAVNGEKIVLAPRWTANNITYILQSLYGFSHARNRTEFNESSKYFDNPAQNIAYADIYGNIGIRPTGLVPIREGNGFFPYNGSKGEGEWIGYVPFEELPHTENPDQHYLASANQIVIGPEYTKYSLQNSYAPGYRARRINELLSNAPDGTISVEKMKEFQTDVESTPSRAFIPFLIDAIESLSSTEKTSIIQDILTELKNWDYEMDKELAGPTIYRKWRDFFMDYTFNDEFEEYGVVSTPQLNVLEQLTRDYENADWFDDITTIPIESRDDIIIKALYQAINSLIEFFGSEDVASWRWGDIHKYYYGHIVPGLDFLSIGPFEGDGEGYTVSPSGVNIRNGVGLAQGGASERIIVDLGNLNNSQSVISSGQRGYSNSKHYSDQVEQLFIHGKYHYQYFTNTVSNFPSSSIESKIYFKPTGGS